MLHTPQLPLLVPIGQRQKAFAQLDRGPKYPSVNAMSGYSHPRWPNVLENGLWARRADDLRAYLKMPQNISYASHVEPQLLAYLLFHHDVAAFTELPEHIGSQNWSGSLAELRKGLKQLKRTPIVTVSKADFSVEWFTFFEKFRQRFPGLGVKFHFVGDEAGHQVQVRP